jgi:hypothetical protein
MLRLGYGDCPTAGRCGGSYDLLAWVWSIAPNCYSSRRGEAGQTCLSPPIPSQAFASIRVPAEFSHACEGFEKNVGEGSRLKIKRGQNAQWTKGGLQYGIPVR